MRNLCEKEYYYNECIKSGYTDVKKGREKRYNMSMAWMISANSKMYRHADSFAARGYIDWRKSANYSKEDIVYIYCTKPDMKIMFKTKVIQVDISFSDITDDEEYWINVDEYKKSQSGKYVRLQLIEQLDTEKLSLEQLKMHGLKAASQGPIHVMEKLLEYIDEVFNDYLSADFFGENEYSEQLLEGAQKTVKVNKYERSSIARDKCIKVHGCFCHICGLNFKNVYGELGKDFIHVHHIKPLSEINDTYIIDYINGLIPICPNCHAMVHRKLNGQNISLEQLKRLYEYNKKMQEKI